MNATQKRFLKTVRYAALAIAKLTEDWSTSVSDADVFDALLRNSDFLRKMILEAGAYKREDSK